MDMASDIKHTLPPSGPLLPNPIGAGSRENAQSSQSGNWPLLDPPNSSPTPGNGSKNENPPNGRSQVRYYNVFFSKRNESKSKCGIQFNNTQSVCCYQLITSKDKHHVLLG